MMPSIGMVMGLKEGGFCKFLKKSYRCATRVSNFVELMVLFIRNAKKLSISSVFAYFSILKLAYATLK